MARRSRPSFGYEEKERRRARQYNAYSRSFSGRLTSLMVDLIFAGVALMVGVTVWFFKQLWIWAGIGFQLVWQGTLWIYHKLKDKFVKFEE